MYTPPATPTLVQTGGYVAGTGAASAALSTAHTVLAVLVLGVLAIALVSLAIRRTEWR